MSILYTPDAIVRKRDGDANTRAEIESLIAGITRREITDYQTAAWLMAVFIRGMSQEETVWLTEAMAASGEQLNMKSRWPQVLDKHSTGGVGDKTSLVLMPALAAAGCRVAKMSGRGLGFTGGTIDKLQSIPGLRTELSRSEFLEQVAHIGIAIASQSAKLAPADGILYALRDVTGTVESIPLIAASIMCKKLALGPGQLVLDVKCGSGSFMKTEAQAHELAGTMVAIGRAAGIRTAAVISDMSQPEGYAIGNALEVREAVEALKGHGPEDVVRMADTLASAVGVTGVRETITSGAAFEKLKQMVAAQGGDVRALDDPTILPSAQCTRELPSPQSGYIAGIDAGILGRTAVVLGGGRRRKEDAIDPSVGIVLKAKVGDETSAGQPLLEVHANDAGRLAQALAELPRAYRFSEEPVRPPELVTAIIPPS